jgi:eukaryotic-like serine/threonine-protein kinase
VAVDGTLRRWWAQLSSHRPGGGHDDDEESRAFLQRRVGFYLGTCFVLWMIIGLANLAAIRAWALESGMRERVVSIFAQHFAFTAVLLAFWLAVALGRRPRWVIHALDLLGTILQPMAAAYMLYGTTPNARSDVSMTMGFIFTVIFRAAVVPSSARRTFLIGIIGWVPLLVSSWLIYSRGALAQLTADVAVTQTAIWATMGVGLATAISRVIYGLRRQVAASARLGQYVLEGKIGEGGMGAVYRGRHALLRRPTAIKVLGVERAGAISLARFEREVQLTSEISHPNVVSIYDYGRSADGAFYYAMEYLDGFDLQRLVEGDGAQPPGRVVHLLVQAAEALAEAHGVGLIHRDVKPANIVVCRHDRRPDPVKVVDFGLVRKVGMSDPAVSTTDAIAGTPLYLSPEAITTPDGIDARSDLYALGAVGYFLLTGTPPFEGKSVFDVLARTVGNPVEPPSARVDHPIPAKLEAIIVACLAKDRAGRPSDATALRQALLDCDDVPSWTAADAAAWWSTRAPALRQTTTPGEVSPFTGTLAVAPRSGPR